MMKAAAALEDAPCCWLCLEEGPDASGQPLVRDCSCRGTSGFAHLSCMITNARHHGRQAVEDEGPYFELSTCFESCPNCKQLYQDNLHYEMLKALIAFVDEEFEDMEHRHLQVCSRRDTIRNVDVENEEDRSKGEAMVTKMLSVMEQLKNYDHWTMGDIKLEVSVYNAISNFYYRIETEEALNKSKLYEEMARDLFRKVGDEGGATIAERNIAAAEVKLSGDESKLDAIFNLDCLRERYEKLLTELGETDTITIDAGVTFARRLADECHAIEAERLLTKLVTTSRRVHGPNHSCTVYATTIFQNWCSVRGVVVKGEGDRIFEALRYENNGEMCVVEGPFLADGTRNRSEDRTLTVPSTDIIPAPGMPVVCIGLEGGEAHLNGKHGETRAFSRENDTFVFHIYFEEKDLEPAKIEPKNLRIIFELPPPE
eukprot:scaffold3543_cov90-Skeletonema_dohrnii-CCMP3373.AAC.6